MTRVLEDGKIEAIETNPNRYYVNVHNAKYPGGAIRGQLVVGWSGSPEHEVGPLGRPRLCYPKVKA